MLASLARFSLLGVDRSRLKPFTKCYVDCTCLQIALVPDLGDTTGHSDGMVAFIEPNTVAVNSDNTAFRKS